MPADELSADKEGGSDGASHLVVLRAIVVLVTLIMSGLMAQILTCHRDVSPPVMYERPLDARLTRDA